MSGCLLADIHDLGIIMVAVFSRIEPETQAFTLGNCLLSKSNSLLSNSSGKHKRINISA